MVVILLCEPMRSLRFFKSSQKIIKSHLNVLQEVQAYLKQIHLTPHKPHPKHHQKPTAAHQHPLVNPLRHQRPPFTYRSRHENVPAPPLPSATTARNTDAIPT